MGRVEDKEILTFRTERSFNKVGGIDTAPHVGMLQCEAVGI